MSAEKQNEIIKQFGQRLANLLKSNAAQFSKGKSGTATRFGFTEPKLKDSIKARFYKTHGDIHKVSISIARHGVFVQKGVGRGHGLSDSGSFTIRTPKDWFNATTEREVNRLADQLAEIKADAALNLDHAHIK